MPAESKRTSTAAASAYTGFSGTQAPVLRRRGRLPAAARGARARLPRHLLDAERDLAARAGRRRLKSVAGAPGAVSLEQRLVQRTTMGQTPAEMARIARLGYEGYLDYQLDYRAIDDRELEDALAAALPSLSLSAAELFSRYRENQGVPAFELIAASVYRALYSPRQLFERMVVFWTDHFNIHLFSDAQPLLKPVDDRQVIRRHALGKFPDLLSASAHSPAMLIYLTNDSNVKGAPNENYARELMELHTLGADNGYTQKDVREVARCFTGWGIAGARSARPGEFEFDPSRHDNGTKKVLGRTISEGGVRDGERVLEILAGSRRTAKFLARKLLVYFWGYEPRKKDVNRVAASYMKTGGDIRAMLRVVLKRGRLERARPKLKRPFHLTTSALRGLFARLDNPGHLLESLFGAGHLPFNWPPPNGYPDSQGFWSGFVLPRWNWGATFLDRRAGGGVALELPWVDPSLGAAKIVDGMNLHLFNGAMSEQTSASLLGFLDAGKKLDKNRIHDAIGLAVASPEFQEY